MSNTTTAVLSGDTIEMSCDPIAGSEFLNNSNNYNYFLKLDADLNMPGRCSPSSIDHMIKEFLPSFEMHNNKTLVTMTDKDFEKAFRDADEMFKRYKVVTGKDDFSSFQDAAKYFGDKKLLITPTGMSGVFNKASTACQSAGSAIHSTYTLAAARMSGLTGVPFIANAPMVLITAPMCGSIFFYTINVISPNSMIGKGAEALGGLCLLPMRGAECVINNVILSPINSITGLSLVTNATSVIVNGFGVKPFHHFKTVYGQIRKHPTIYKPIIGWFKGLVGH